MNIIGGLNYNAVLSTEDHQSYRNLLEAEILNRFKLSMGVSSLGSGISAPTGIVDAQDPTVISSTDTTRALIVTKSSTPSTNISVAAGLAVTPNGALINFSGVQNFTLNNVNAYTNQRIVDGSVLVAYIQNTLNKTGQLLPNDYGQQLYPQEAQETLATKILKLAFLADWNDKTQFTSDILANCVSLAIITVTKNVTDCNIDLTKSVYYWNRPWFTIQDTQHRAKVGTGTQSDQNPHAMSINDFSVAKNVGLFQGLCDTGLIVAKDRDIPKMTGLFCSETIPAVNIKTDANGTITSKSIYGKINARYCTLSHFPTRLGSIYYSGNPANSIAGELIDGTNIVVFSQVESLFTDLIVEYTRTQALEPPVPVSGNTITFGTISSNEAVITGGKAYGTVADPTISVENSGPFPRRYSIYLLADGTLAQFPQIIYPAQNLSVFGTSQGTTVSPVYTLQYPARLCVGLTTRTPVDPTMHVSITIRGKDAGGNLLVRDFDFSAANGYVDIPTTVSTNYDFSGQLRYSGETGATGATGGTGATGQASGVGSVYTVVDSIEITKDPTTNTPIFVNPGNDAIFQVWAECEPGNSTALNDDLKICTLGWDGTSISHPEIIESTFKGSPLFDERAIYKNFFVKKPEAESVANQYKLLEEKFEDLRYFDSFRGFNTYIQPSGSIALLGGAITASQFITLTPYDSISGLYSKVISATGATGATGLTHDTVNHIDTQTFNVGADTATTLTNMMTAINNPTFNSGITAVQPSSATTLALTLNTPVGVTGNTYAITGSPTSNWQLSGFSSGFEPIGECYLDRSKVGLRSRNVPATNALTDLASYFYREKYRSRAIGIPYNWGVSGTVFRVFLQGLDLFYPKLVRIRGSNLSDPKVWLPWQIVTLSDLSGAAGNCDLGTSVHKIQVEFYGKAEGISVYKIS